MLNMQSRQRDLCILEEYFIQSVVELGKLSLLSYRVQLSNGSSANASQIISCSHFNNTRKILIFFYALFIFLKFHTHRHAPERVFLKFKLIKSQTSWFTTKLQTISLGGLLLWIINHFTVDLSLYQERGILRPSLKVGGGHTSWTLQKLS